MKGAKTTREREDEGMSDIEVIRNDLQRDQSRERKKAMVIIKILLVATQSRTAHASFDINTSRSWEWIFLTLRQEKSEATKR